MTLFLFFYALPIIVGWFVAEDRNRTPWKGALAAVFFGWIGVIVMLAVLKRRDVATGILV